MNPSIVGWAHTPFGRSEGTIEDLIATVTHGAIADAGLTAADVDAVWVGHFNSGLVSDGFPASLALQADQGLRWKPATRVENACASGSCAFNLAVTAIRAGEADVAMALGAEGIRIQCSGRLGGADIARREWQRKGRVPLHTLRENIDYGFAEAQTVYGKIGVKCWICKKEADNN